MIHKEYPSGKKVSVIIPLHNEEANIPHLIKELIPAIINLNYEIILVNDNSTDLTPVLINNLSSNNPKIKAVHRISNPGFGEAIKFGFRYATGDILIPVMGDLSDDPYDIAKLAKKIEEGYDIAYGSRFIEGGSTNSYPTKKLIANRIFNNLARIVFLINRKDITNAFKAYNRNVIDTIGLNNLKSSGFELTLELPLKAHFMGFKSIEVPVTWHGRKRGKANLKLSTNGPRYLFRLLALFFRLQ